MNHPSKILAPVRTIGLFSGNVAPVFSIDTQEKRTSIIIATKNFYQTFSAKKLAFLYLSEALPSDITALALLGYFVFCCCKSNIHVCIRGKTVRVYEGHKHDLKGLVVLGQHIISWDIEGFVHIWNYVSLDLHLQLDFSVSTFWIETILHPATYLNKILIGFSNGTMQLWNIKSGKAIYSFKGWDSAVKVLEQAPAVDIVGIGLMSGDIHIMNIRTDEVIMSFHQNWGSVTGLSFRIDGEAILASASNTGHLAFWNLEEQELVNQKRSAHLQTITGLLYYPNESFLLTSSPDNSIKVWSFQSSDGIPTVLRERSGHQCSSSFTRFVDSNTILSAGQDAVLRSFAMNNPIGNRNFGFAHTGKATKEKRNKLDEDPYKWPPIICFDFELSRKDDWDSIITCHRNYERALTWNYAKGCTGSHALVSKTTAEITACCITHCGSYCALGFSDGNARLYNMQSGLFRGIYEADFDKDLDACNVIGIHVDVLQQWTIVIYASGLINYFTFKRKTFHHSLKLMEHTLRTRFHPDNGMLAVACLDYSVRIVDTEVNVIVRIFSGHRHLITDMAFFPDGRWLMTSSMDSSIRIWDLPNDILIDCFETEAPVVVLDVSPNGDLVITGKADDVALCLWANKTLYKPINILPLPKDITPIEVTETFHHYVSNEFSDNCVNVENQDVDDDDIIPPIDSTTSHSKYITLSDLPASRWRYLLYIDQIKARNKPKEAPKKLHNVPFFLPTVPGLEFQFAVEDKTDEDSQPKQHEFSMRSDLCKTLDRFLENEDYTIVLSRLKKLSPSAIDYDIRSLSEDEGGSLDDMIAFIRFLTVAMATLQNYEILTSYAALFMKHHSAYLSKESSAVSHLEEFRITQKQLWLRLQGKLLQNLSLISFLKNPII